MGTLRTSLLVVFGLTFIASFPFAAQAEEIQVLCSNGLKAVMEGLAPQFERASGHKIVVRFGLAAGFKQQIESGEGFDLAILTPAMIDDLIKQGRMAADSRATIARTGLGVMIRAGAGSSLNLRWTGAGSSDVNNTDAFKKSLLSVKAIAFAREGASGVAFAALIEKLGIAGELKSRLRPTSTGEEVVSLVAGGGAEFGILPLSEILGVRGVELGGMFPNEVQSYIVMAGAVGSKARQPKAARELLDFLMSPKALSAIKAKGMERP
jgi:molybdate transport system substrate-binding protein